MQKIHEINPKKIRYLLVGGINTVIGYSIGVGIYKLLSNQVNIVLIGFISNILTITISFLTYKIFVFKTKGRWIIEYLKAYVVYGSMAIFGTILLWFFVDLIGFNIWITQALIIMITVAFSYIGHVKYTFNH